MAALASSAAWGARGAGRARVGAARGSGSGPSAAPAAPAGASPGGGGAGGGAGGGGGGGTGRGGLPAALLEEALRGGHVARHGFTERAVRGACGARGLSPAAAALLRGGAVDLVEHFLAGCRRDLALGMTGRAEDLAALRVRDRVALGLRLRLEMTAPLVDHWPGALAVLASPRGAPVALKHAAWVADEVWHHAGCRSADHNWYSKRLLVAGVYSAAELHLLTDCSPGFEDTWGYLDRALGRAMVAGKAAGDLLATASALSGALRGAAGQVLGPHRPKRPFDEV